MCKDHVVCLTDRREQGLGCRVNILRHEDLLVHYRFVFFPMRLIERVSWSRGGSRSFIPDVELVSSKVVVVIVAGVGEVNVLVIVDSLVSHDKG